MFIMTSYFAMKYNSFDIVVNFISLQIFLFLIHIYIYKTFKREKYNSRIIYLQHFHINSTRKLRLN